MKSSLSGRFVLFSALAVATWVGCGTNESGRAPSRPDSLHPLSTPVDVYPCADGLVTHGTSSCTSCTTGTVNTTNATGDIIGDEGYSDFCGETIALISMPLLLDDPVLGGTFCFNTSNIVSLDVTTPQVEVFCRSTNHAGSCPAVTAAARCSTWTSLGVVDVSSNGIHCVNLSAGQINGGGEMQFKIEDASVFESGSGYQKTRVSFSESSGTSNDPKLTIDYDI